MSELLLRFLIRLESSEQAGAYENHGPLFHRWIPDGEKDAITLDTGDSDITLRVWFARWGYVSDNGWIVFSYERREFDTSVMDKQGILEAGPLMGMLKIKSLSDAELLPMKEHRLGDKAYVELGRRVFDLLWAPVSGFLDLLRIHYGQYWIRNVERWDPSKGSIGHYFRTVLEMEGSLDDGRNWFPFIPDEQVIRITGVVADKDS